MKRMVLFSGVAFLVVAAALVLGSCVPLRARGLGLPERYDASLEVTVQCIYPAPREGSAAELLVKLMGGLPEGGYGSAVAVGPSHALTARHVVDCDLELPLDAGTLDGEPMKITVEDEGGASVEVVVQEQGADASDDVAVLVAVEGKHPFRTWAAVSDHNPARGDVVCTAPAFPFRGHRCGPVQSYRHGDGWMGSGYVIYDLHSDPGNSGAGVYGEDGRLVAIHVASVGRHAGGGYVVGKWRGRVPQVWADLVMPDL